MPLSIIGTYGVMALLGFSINNVSLLALTLARYGYVLETGLVVMQGNARELLQDDGVEKAYLGI